MTRFSFFHNKEQMIRLVIWLIPVGLVGYLVFMNLAPTGTLHLKYTVNDQSPMITDFASKEPDRVIGVPASGNSSDYFQLITTSPVYMNLQLPRLFPKATVTLTYRNPDQQPVIKLGVRTANGSYYYRDMAIQEPALDNLGPYWHEINDGDTIVWEKDQSYYATYAGVSKVYDEAIDNLESRYGADGQRSAVQDAAYEEERDHIEQLRDEQLQTINIGEFTPRYQRVDSFLGSLPPLGEIAEYNFDLSHYYELPGYTPSTRRTVIDALMRGPHDIYTYIGSGEPLDVTFTVQDINRHAGADEIAVNVYDSQNVLQDTIRLADDGITGATGVVSPERTLTVYNPDLPFGVYRLQFDVDDDDVFIRKIDTAQHLIVFNKLLYIVDNPEYADIRGDGPPTPTTVYTNSSYVDVSTAHDDGFQTITVNGQSHDITETHTPVSLIGLEGLTSLYIPKNDVRLEGNGVFALSRDQFFDPFGTYVANAASVDDIDSYNYIIAYYPKPEEVDGWLQASQTVEVPSLYINQDKHNQAQFILSLPGLPEHDRTLQIKQVDIVFEKDPLTISSAWEKLMNKFGQ